MTEEPTKISKISKTRNPANRDVSRMCAKIHMQEIPDGFLPTFGIGFLSHLYSHIASSNRSFLIVASRCGEVCGFICGSYGNGSLYKSFLARKFFKVAIPIAVRLFSPGVLNRIREILNYPAGESMDNLPRSEILNFCVSRNYQGRGVGQLLFRSMCEEFLEKGISQIRIVTGANQLSAQKFYVRIGARKVADMQIHQNVSSNIYVYTITKRGT